MTKQSHVVRVWAGRGGRHTLEFSLDSVKARRLGLLRVNALEHDPTVQDIEMREHVVLVENGDGPHGIRRTLRWVRSGDRWRRLPDSQRRSRSR